MPAKDLDISPASKDGDSRQPTNSRTRSHRDYYMCWVNPEAREHATTEWSTGAARMRPDQASDKPETESGMQSVMRSRLEVSGS